MSLDEIIWLLEVRETLLSLDIREILGTLNFYQVIWSLSLSLAGLSLLLMLVLVVRRVIGDRAQRRHEARRQKMLDWLLDYLGAVSPDLAGEFLESEADAEIVAEVVAHLLRSISGEERDRLIAVLRSLGGVERPLEQLRHGEEWQRVAAAAGLHHLEGPGVLEGLRMALDDPSPDVRCAAARALFHQGAVSSAQLLIDRLVIEAGVPPEALRDIFRGLGPLFYQELIAALNSDSENARIVAVDALGHSGDLSIVEPLLDLIDGAPMEIAAKLYRALGLLGDPRALKAVMRGLADPAWEVRCQAAFCAGKIRAIEANDILADLLDDPTWWVRYRAAEALFEIGTQGITVLRQLSQEATSAGRTAQLILAEKAVPA